MIIDPPSASDFCRASENTGAGEAKIRECRAGDGTGEGKAGPRAQRRRPAAVVPAGQALWSSATFPVTGLGSGLGPTADEFLECGQIT